MKYPNCPFSRAKSIGVLRLLKENDGYRHWRCKATKCRVCRRTSCPFGSIATAAYCVHRYRQRNSPRRPSLTGRLAAGTVLVLYRWPGMSGSRERTLRRTPARRNARRHRLSSALFSLARPRQGYPATLDAPRRIGERRQQRRTRCSKRRSHGAAPLDSSGIISGSD